MSKADSPSSNSTSTTAVDTFKKPFNAAKQAKYTQRLDGIKGALDELDRAVVVLKATNTGNWKNLDEFLQNRRDFVVTLGKTAQETNNFGKKARAALDEHEKALSSVAKTARAKVGSVAAQHAQTLLTQLKNDVGNRQFPKAVFDDLNQKFTAVSTNTGKTSKDTEDPYVPIIVEATTALKKRDEARTKWQTLDPKKTSDDAARLEILARALNLAAVATKTKVAADGCTQANMWLAEGRFAEAYSELKAANFALAGAQKDYDAQIGNLVKASDVLKGLRQPADAKLQFGKAHQMDWLVNAAEKVTKGIDAAVALENFGPLQHPASRQAALKLLPEIVKLNDQWAVYQEDLKEWDELNLLITQYLGLAKTFVASAKKHQADQSGNVSEWQQIEKQAQDFPASIKPAQDLAMQSKPRDAINKASAPKTAFVALRGKFNKAIKAEVTNDFQTSSSNNPNGPEAQLQSVLNKQEVQEMLVPAHNLLELAKQEGLPANTLSHGDAVAIYAYTNEQTCNAIQAHLRNPNQTDPNEKQRLDMIAKLAEDAMRKLPTYTGTPTKRGEKDWPGADARYQPNSSPFTINFFWSTSVGAPFPGLYQITVKPNPAKANAKMITAFSQYVKEGEVVFPKGTTFKVISRTPVSKERIDVHVEEV